jgi:hypothetical protein
MMTPNPFVAPAIAEMVVARLREGMASAGGEAGLLSKLLAGNDDVFDKLAAADYRAKTIFVRLLDDADFRLRLLDVLDPSDAGFLRDFLAAIELWRIERPSSYEVVRSQMLGSPVQPLGIAIPSQVNDISRVYSIISTDTLTESLRVKCAARLIRPQKALGGDDIFIISSSLASFYYSISALIRSLITSESERQAVTVSLGKEEKSSLYEALETIEQRVKELRTQTEAMIGPKPGD